MNVYGNPGGSRRWICQIDILRLLFARKFTSYRRLRFYSSVQDMYKTNPGEFSVLINRSMMFDSLYEKLNEARL